jgi:hypothetical protein
MVGLPPEIAWVAASAAASTLSSSSASSFVPLAAMARQYHNTSFARMFASKHRRGRHSQGSDSDSDSSGDSDRSRKSGKSSKSSKSSKSNSSRKTLAAEGEYDPLLLDDPRLKSGKHRTVMTLPGVLCYIGINDEKFHLIQRR